MKAVVNAHLPNPFEPGNLVENRAHGTVILVTKDNGNTFTGITLYRFLTTGLTYHQSGKDAYQLFTGSITLSND